MDIKDSLELIKEDLGKVDIECKKNLENEGGLIHQVGEYILKSGGKRIRPLLLLLSARLCNYTGTRHISLATVIEYIHTATLLHDDVVDDAAMRRGIPSVNTVWGNSVSVLVGDFLLAKSFSKMVEDGDLRILKILSDVTTKMARGEVTQLTKCKDISILEEEYNVVIQNKTACLFSAACQIGAILGHSTEEKESSLSEFGLKLGIAFQLVDDALDYLSEEKRFGKILGNDLQGGKLTMPLIYTLRNCDEYEREKIISIINSNGKTKYHFEEILDIILKREGIDYTLNRARKYINEGKEYLNIFNSSEKKQTLLTVADYVINRKW